MAAPRFGINPDSIRGGLYHALIEIDFLANSELWKGLDVAAKALHDFRAGGPKPAYPETVRYLHQQVPFTLAETVDERFFTEEAERRLNNSGRYFTKQHAVPVVDPKRHYSLKEFVDRFNAFVPRAGRTAVDLDELYAFLAGAEDANTPPAVTRPAALQACDVTEPLLNAVSSAFRKQLETEPEAAVDTLQRMATPEAPWWLPLATSHKNFTGDLAAGVLAFYETWVRRAPDTREPLATNLKNYIDANPGLCSRSWLYNHFDFSHSDQPALTASAYLDYVLGTADYSDASDGEILRKTLQGIGRQAALLPVKAQGVREAVEVFGILSQGTPGIDAYTRAKLLEETDPATAAAQLTDRMRAEAQQGNVTTVKTVAAATVGLTPREEPTAFGGSPVVPPNSDAAPAAQDPNGAPPPGPTPPPPAPTSTPTTKTEFGQVMLNSAITTVLGTFFYRPPQLDANGMPATVVGADGVTRLADREPGAGAKLMGQIYDDLAEKLFRLQRGIPWPVDDGVQRTNETAALAGAFFQDLGVNTTTGLAGWGYDAAAQGLAGLYWNSPNWVKGVFPPAVAEKVGPAASSLLRGPLLNGVQAATSALVSGKFTEVLPDAWKALSGGLLDGIKDTFWFLIPVEQRVAMQKGLAAEARWITVWDATNEKAFQERSTAMGRALGRPRVYLEFFGGSLAGTKLEFHPLPGVASLDGQPNPIGVPGVLFKAKANIANIPIISSHPTVQHLGILTDIVELSGLFLPYQATPYRTEPAPGVPGRVQTGAPTNDKEWIPQNRQWGGYPSLDEIPPGATGVS